MVWVVVFFFWCLFWWVTFQCPHLKNVSKCSPRVHGNNPKLIHLYSPGQMIGKPTSLFTLLSLGWQLASKSGVSYCILRAEGARTAVLPFSFPPWYTYCTWPVFSWKHIICPWICVSFVGSLHGKQWLGWYVGCSFSNSFYSSNKYLWCECTQLVCIQYCFLCICFLYLFCTLFSLEFQYRASIAQA